MNVTYQAPCPSCGEDCVWMGIQGNPMTGPDLSTVTPLCTCRTR